MKQISLNKSLSIEFTKNKFLISLSLLFIVTGLNYFYISYGDLPKGQEWQMIFSSIPFLNTMLISIMMSVLASRCIDIENKGNMWNTLPTLESRKKLFSSKLLFGLMHIALFCFIQTIMILYLGIKFMIGGGFPIFALLQTEFAEIIFGMIIFQLQCLLSLKFRNQFAALSIAFGGTLAGVFIAFVSKAALTPWSVLFSLSTVTMDYDSATRNMLLSWNAIDIKAIFISFLYFFATYKLSLSVFNNPETGNFKIAHVNRKSKNAHTILPAELVKMKRNPVWIPFALIPLISAGIGIINFLSNQGVLSFDWANLWTQESLFLGLFFLSPLIAILASLDFRMEHLGTNWNIMLTSSSRFKVLKDKWLTVATMSSICMIWIAFIYIVSGKLIGITGSIPKEFYLRIFASILCIIAISSFQCMLSLIIPSFAIPVGLAFLGNILGLLLTVKGFFYATPFSMLIYSMGSTNITREINLPVVIITCMLYIFISFAIGLLYLNRTDIKTGR